MSAGAPKKDKIPKESTRWLLSDPVVRALFARPWKLDCQHDIPYLAGYSVDGRTIYIDRRLPKALKANRPFHPTLYLPVHERTEKAILDALRTFSTVPRFVTLRTRVPYLLAHGLATQAEHEAVKVAHLVPREYEEALKPWIRRCDDETVRHPPADLDLTPYEDEHDRKILRELGVKN